MMISESVPPQELPDPVFFWQIGGLYFKNEDATNKHWLIDYADATNKHWLVDYADATNKHWLIDYADATNKHWLIDYAE